MPKPLDDDPTTVLRLMAPPDDEFSGKDFMPAEALAALAAHLIDRYDELHFLRDYTLETLWRRSGGRKGLRGVLGKCLAPSGLTRFFSGADWIIWLAADHVRSHALNAHQTEALLYHELLHCSLGDDPKNLKPTVVTHDIEAFNNEMEHYGIWADDLVEVASTIGRQLRLLEDPAA